MKTKTISELASALLSDFKKLQQTIDKLRLPPDDYPPWTGDEHLRLALIEVEAIGKAFKKWCEDNYATEEYSQEAPWEEKILLESVLEKCAVAETVAARGWNQRKKNIVFFLQSLESSKCFEKCSTKLEKAITSDSGNSLAKWLLPYSGSSKQSKSQGQILAEELRKYYGKFVSSSEQSPELRLQVRGITLEELTTRVYLAKQDGSSDDGNPISLEVFKTFASATEDCLKNLSEFREVATGLKGDLKTAWFRNAEKEEEAFNSLLKSLNQIDSIRARLFEQVSSTRSDDFQNGKATLSEFYAHKHRGLLHKTYKIIIALRDATKQAVQAMKRLETLLSQPSTLSVGDLKRSKELIVEVRNAFDKLLKSKIVLIGERSIAINGMEA